VSRRGKGGECYQVLDLAQQSPEWLEWRNHGVGASDAPAILGENPWKSRDHVLREKVSGLAPRSNGRMQRGTALEPEARRQYIRILGVDVRPACLQSVSYGWLRASVDGIKCGERVYEETALARCPPRHYVGQLQHILAVTGLPAIDFWCFLPGRPNVHLAVARDEPYIRRLLAAEEAFWTLVLDARSEGSARSSK